MSTEEYSPEDEDEEEEELDIMIHSDWREKQQKKNRVAINQFLGKGKRHKYVGILPRYYGELLTWALNQYLEREGCKIIATLGYKAPEPIYIDVTTDVGISKNLIMRGQMLMEKDDNRFIITVDMNPRWRASFQVEGQEEKKDKIESLVNAVLTIAKEENIYRGKKIEFAGRIRFLNIGEKLWDSIIIDSTTKREIQANTTDFLRRSDLWEEYNIPLKRGILLAGEPGIGKTIICKALMTEAKEFSCITTNGYSLDEDDYITELYELAADLSPSIVFIEDIDLIGQNRMEFGYQRGPALISLLTILDGVEEHKKIVTVATTNCLETLDRALSQRPSRFDRVITLSRPSIEQRRDLVSNLCQSIPLDKDTQDYIAHSAENCTPAQLQEIIYSLVIWQGGDHAKLTFSKDEIDQITLKINNRNKRQIGFGINNNHNGNESEQIRIVRGRI
ncbi:AAA family ATPase [Chloroflexota bacterium]